MPRKGLKNIAALIDAAKEELPVQDEFLMNLKHSIEKQDANNRRKPSQTYKPSSMTCIRNMYYQRTGTEEDDLMSNYSMIGICNAGTDIHERTQKAIEGMKANGFDCEYVDVAKFIKSRRLKDIEIVSRQGMETKLFNKRYNISFLCDGIVKFKGKYYILELKSEASFKWNVRKEPAPEHYNQVTCYSISLGLDEVLFIYISRDMLDMKCYLFEPTGEMKQNLIGMITNCEQCVIDGKVPPKPQNVSKKACEYCHYRGQCRKDG